MQSRKYKPLWDNGTQDNTHVSTKSYNNCMVEERDNVLMIEIVHTDDI